MDARTAYREQSAQGTSQIGMVVALYDQAALDLSRAIAALQNNDIERRTREIDHALAVLQQLHGRLDFERGGEVARNLERFYNLVRSRLLDAQCQTSIDILREQMELLLSLRSAWAELERAEQAPKGQAIADDSPLSLVPQKPHSSTWRA